MKKRIAVTPTSEQAKVILNLCNILDINVYHDTKETIQRNIKENAIFSSLAYSEEEERIVGVSDGYKYGNFVSYTEFIAFLASLKEEVKKIELPVKIGEWFCLPNHLGFKEESVVGRITRIDEEGETFYFEGRTYSGGFREDYYPISVAKDKSALDFMRKATPDEVKKVLFDWAIELGFTEHSNIYFKSVKDTPHICEKRKSKVDNVNFGVDTRGYSLYSSYGVIYFNGEWAEIIKDELPEINGYKGTYNKEDNFIKYGCAEIPVEYFKRYEVNRDIESITLSSGVELKRDDIIKIRKVLENNE